MGSFVSKIKRNRRARRFPYAEAARRARAEESRARYQQWSNEVDERIKREKAAREQAKVDRRLAEADVEDFKSWCTPVVQERNRRARIHRLKLKKAERWSPYFDQMGCGMGRDDCECNRGIDFGKFLNNRVPLGLKFACYAQVEKELRPRIGRPPKPQGVDKLPPGWFEPPEAKKDYGIWTLPS
ncbi:hypothetical protein PWT90_08317 [Aphanocladium album]|nr:hypothetical protein PWT90_08317 [Aphanocladium album]